MSFRVINWQGLFDFGFFKLPLSLWLQEFSQWFRESQAIPAGMAQTKLFLSAGSVSCIQLPYVKHWCKQPLPFSLESNPRSGEHEVLSCASLTTGQIWKWCWLWVTWVGSWMDPWAALPCQGLELIKHLPLCWGDAADTGDCHRAERSRLGRARGGVKNLPG